MPINDIPIDFFAPISSDPNSDLQSVTLNQRFIKTLDFFAAWNSYSPQSPVVRRINFVPDSSPVVVFGENKWFLGTPDRDDYNEYTPLMCGSTPVFRIVQPKEVQVKAYIEFHPLFTYPQIREAIVQTYLLKLRQESESE